MASPLGDKIRARRTELNMSLDQLAKAAECSKGYLWELENRDKANPSADKLIKIAAALGLTTEFLLDHSAEVEPATGVLDEAFFRRYKELDSKRKEKVQRFLEMWDDED
jgi:transcriptional regulator with XRE-family HTH domain